MRGAYARRFINAGLGTPDTVVWPCCASTSSTAAMVRAKVILLRAALGADGDARRASVRNVTITTICGSPRDIPWTRGLPSSSRADWRVVGKSHGLRRYCSNGPQSASRAIVERRRLRGLGARGGKLMHQRDCTRARPMIIYQQSLVRVASPRSLTARFCVDGSATCFRPRSSYRTACHEFDVSATEARWREQVCGNGLVRRPILFGSRSPPCSTVGCTRMIPLDQTNGSNIITYDGELPLSHPRLKMPPSAGPWINLAPLQSPSLHDPLETTPDSNLGKTLKKVLPSFVDSMSQDLCGDSGERYRS